MNPLESVISDASGKIVKLLNQDVDFPDGLDLQLRLISEELKQWKRIFPKIKEIGRRKHDDKAKALVADVIDVACDVENAVEMVELGATGRRRIGPMEEKSDDIFVPLRNIGAKIEEIKKKTSIFDPMIVEEKTARSSSTRWSMEGSCVPEIREGDQGPISLIKRLREYGRSAALSQGENVIDSRTDADLLAQRLTSGDQRCSVVSIVAPEGAGKTTLAHAIYKRDDVKKHFAAAAWITVYWRDEQENYYTEALLRDIAEQVDMPEEDAAQMNLEDLQKNGISKKSKELQKNLSKFLQEKRFLIVLDNMWNVAAWDQLKEAFPDGKNGSRIMLTTWNMGVASHVNPNPANPPYKLPLLTPESSWKLFLKKAFPWMAGEITCPAQLEDIGKEIVEACKGLPLAIEVTGGLIAAREEGNVMDWKLVLGSLKEQQFREPEDCSKVLALGYHDLPYYLKSCFLYFSLFPSGRKINVEKLMMLWVAEGFIQPREGQSKEDTAKEYFLELAGRSLIQVDREWDGEAVTCSINGPLYALACSEGARHNFSQVSPPYVAARRMAIIDKVNANVALPSRERRSLLFFTPLFFSEIKLVDKIARCLRVLDLEGLKIEESMLNLTIKRYPYLKYLNLRGTSIEKLPQSIGNLYTLEILLLDYNTFLPKEIWKLNRLRHLYALDCEFDGPPQFEHLQNLHTLCISVGDWIEDCRLSSLSSLGILKLTGDIGSHFKWLWPSIEKLINLRSLVLSDSWIAEDRILPCLAPLLHLYEVVLAVNLERLSEPHEFPLNLTRLVLDGSGLQEDPMPTLEKLSNLQILQLSSNAYQGKKMISSAGGFPKLTCLAFFCMKELVEWIVGERAMPKLAHLSISFCPNLNMLPEGLRFITTLKEFETWDISKELYDRLQESQGEDWYKIQKVPYLRICQ